MWYQISNLLSIARMVLIVPAGWALWTERDALALALIGLAALSDVLDGHLARKLKQISDLGKILDPLADKVFVGMITVVLLLQERVPVWFVALILLRDALILAGGLYARRRTGIVLASNYLGKAAVVATGLAFIAIIARLGPAYEIILMTLASGLMGASLVVYGRRFGAALRHGKRGRQKPRRA